MTDLTPFVKSHPSVRVRQILASAEIDVPAAGSKERALVALARDHRHAHTTNFSGVALGNTVNRLLGAVTLYGSNAGPLRLLARGSMVGAAVGALALASIVSIRWLRAPDATEVIAAARPPTTNSPATTMSLDARREALLRGAAVELDAGRPAAALESLDTLVRFQPAPREVPPITLLRVKALLRLARVAEAKAVAAPLLAGPPCPEVTELRALLEPPATQSPSSSAK